jgi:hypothetical protein
MALRESLRKAVGRAVPLSRDVVTVNWASESLAEDLVRYVDAFYEDADARPDQPDWNKSYGTSLWKDKTTKSVLGVNTRVKCWQFNLTR